MKKRLTPILTISVAIILIGSLAYAADKRKQAKQGNQTSDPTHEEEALIAELLESVADHDKKAPAVAETGKVVASSADKKISQLSSSK